MAKTFMGVRLRSLDEVAEEGIGRLPGRCIDELDIAVDDVPRIRPLDPDSVTWPDEVVADGPVPLSRLIPAGVDKHGAATRARVVVFRKPLEMRAKHPDDLADLLHDVLVQQVATYLRVDPEVIDPGRPPG